MHCKTKIEYDESDPYREEWIGDLTITVSGYDLNQVRAVLEALQVFAGAYVTKQHNAGCPGFEHLGGDITQTEVGRSWRT